MMATRGRLLRFVVLSLLVLSGCASLRTMLSTASKASFRCAKCTTEPCLVDEPFNCELSWDCDGTQPHTLEVLAGTANSPEAEASRSLAQAACAAKNLIVDAQCSAGDCQIDRSGGDGYRTFTVTPRAEGVLRLHVSARDIEERSFDSDTLQVKAIEKIAITCDAQDVRGKSRPCNGRVEAGSRISFGVLPVNEVAPPTSPRLRIEPASTRENAPTWTCGEMPRMGALQQKAYQCLAVDVPKGKYRATASLGGRTEVMELEVR